MVGDKLSNQGRPTETKDRGTMSRLGWARRVALGFVFAATMAGCVTTPPPISVDEARTWKVVSVEGALAQVASSAWISVKHDFMKANGLEDKIIESGDRDTPRRVIEAELPREQFRTYIAAQFSDRVKQSFTAKMQREFTGNRPVKIVVTMHHAVILDPGRRFLAMLVAGQSGDQNTLTAHIDVIDARSGQILVSYPRTVVTGVGGGASFDFSGGPIIENDPMLRMVNQLREQFLRWILRSA
ncbi:hypothetical protein AB4099_31315 [Bosea sp. 2KB_26]|uniref:hypothetical protein n=1 Tax=Bosea sp. 2KB_26 TaxID=3237475 RepID=UPI000DE4173B